MPIEEELGDSYIYSTVSKQYNKSINQVFSFNTAYLPLGGHSVN